MSVLRIDPAAAREIAAKLESNATARLDDLSTLKAVASPEAVWAGESATSYTHAYERWEAAERELVHALEGLARIVRQVADNHDEIERSGRQALDGF
ncbi:WXG100 family type VII secretion target [Arthrobacter sp. CJ23]|uniref:WXG100 family type VII secretion target n=1 Tax=Arthrobacter sp. CJ23 TaxID=2972479 RepID=UPI00215BEF54|nr:WXG100 family type VII secretion target [Arthrobacter sp. CJ23]UVJ38051.1 WXG100 family type VII secretion target [Arthrobacter sp. CJ23]